MQASGKQAQAAKLLDARQDRNVGGVDQRPHVGILDHLGQVTDQAEAGHVGAGMHGQPVQRLGRPAVKRGHYGD